MNHDPGHFNCTLCVNFFYNENKKTVSDHESKGTSNFLIKIKLWILPTSVLSMLIRTVLYLYLFIYLFMAVLGLRFCARAFSSCSKWGPVFIAVRGPLIIAASLVAEHRFQTRRLSNCGSRAQLVRGMWDLPRPGLEPVSPALAGRFSTTVPPGKPDSSISLKFILVDVYPGKHAWTFSTLNQGDLMYSCKCCIISDVLCLDFSIIPSVAKHSRYLTGLLKLIFFTRGKIHKKLSSGWPLCN